MVEMTGVSLIADVRSSRARPEIIAEWIASQRHTVRRRPARHGSRDAAPFRILSYVLFHSYRLFSWNDCARRLLVLMEYRGKTLHDRPRHRSQFVEMESPLGRKDGQNRRVAHQRGRQAQRGMAVDKALAPKMVK